MTASTPGKPIRFVDEIAVARVLAPEAARDAVRSAFVAAARGAAVCPVRTVIPTGGAWFATMPAWIDGAEPGLGVKLVSAVPANAARGLPTHAAVVVLFDPDTGLPRALVAADTITARRTAAASLLATERLARMPQGPLAILGAGVAGRAHLEAFAAAGFAEDVRVWSRSRASADALAADGAAYGATARAVSSVSEALAGAAVVVTATNAETPLFALEDLADGAHVNAVGACVPSRRELPTALMAVANVYADDVLALRAESGDVGLAERDLGRRIEVRATLGEMLADPSRADPIARATVFESLGLGIADVACAVRVCAALDEVGADNAS